MLIIGGTSVVVRSLQSSSFKDVYNSISVRFSSFERNSQLVETTGVFLKKNNDPASVMTITPKFKEGDFVKDGSGPRSCL